MAKNVAKRDAFGVKIDPERWDNLHGQDQAAEILAEYFREYDDLQEQIDEAKQRVKDIQKTRKDLAQIVRGKTGLREPEVAEAYRLFKMGEEERAQAVREHTRALLLACEVAGVEPPAMQLDMMDLWDNPTSDGDDGEPVFDQTDAGGRA